MNSGERAVAGCAVAIGILILSALIYSGLGWVCAWVLSYFGLKVPWFVCAVGLWLCRLAFGSVVKVDGKS